MAAEAKEKKSLTASERAMLEKHGYKVLHYADGTEVCKVTCPRCGGTGSYSYCQMYGTDCFQCKVASGGKHVGYVFEPAGKTARRLKRREAAERKAAERAAAVEAALAGKGFVSVVELRNDAFRVKQERAAEAKARRDAEVAAGNYWLLDVLGRVPYPSEFVNAMRAKLASEPLAGLSDRCVDILRDIYAKTVSGGARRNSKAYGEAEDEFYGHLEPAEELCQ